jgi:DNA repair protein RadC
MSEADVRSPPLLVRDMAPDERPRERLLRGGAQVLSDVELLAVLILSGCKGRSSIDVARDLLRTRGGIGGLVGLRPEAVRVRGIGGAKAATILAAVEFARRLSRIELTDRHPLADPAAAAQYLSLRFTLPDQEVMGALYLDTRNRLVAESEVFRGTLSRAAVEPRALLKESLIRGAAGIVLFHTHPSGDPSPSAEDLAFTRRLAEAGEIVGVRLVDHLILGSAGRWVSLRQRGGW